MDLDTAVARVVDSGRCSGCGACALLDDGLALELDGEGFARPVRRAPSTAPRDAVARFRRSCPGVRVSAVREPGIRRHPLLGPVVDAWRVHAADPEIRRRGASGGALTALVAWALETGRIRDAVGAAAREGAPRRTVPVRLTTREEALAAAGSRYAPVGVVGDPAVRGAGAVVAKPCEIAALHGLEPASERWSFSFFCAGTPAQGATEALLAELGVERDERLDSLAYRGDGWPGRFRARTADGREVSTDYEDSWGRVLGRRLQPRCRICPDGVGEWSDVTAADLWDADEDGYPVFSEGDGTSALLARTRRGAELVRDAIADGVLAATPLELEDLVAVQPLQRERRTLLAGRLAGTVVAGRRVPRFPGFGLLRLGLAEPRRLLRTARGAFRRARRSR